LEQQLLVSQVFQSHYADVGGQQAMAKVNAAIDKALIRLIDQACESERPGRAIDLCQLTKLDKTIELAYKVAQKRHLPRLAAKFEEILGERRRREQNEGEVVGVPPPHQSVSGASASGMDAVERSDHAFVTPLPVRPLIPAPRSMTETPSRVFEEAMAITPQGAQPVSVKNNPFKRTIKETPVGLKPGNMFNTLQQEQEMRKHAKASVAQSSDLLNAKKRKLAQPSLNHFKKASSRPSPAVTDENQEVSSQETNE
jgi:hypothetical protein